MPPLMRHIRAALALLVHIRAEAPMLPLFRYAYVYATPAAYAPSYALLLDAGYAVDDAFSLQAFRWPMPLCCYFRYAMLAYAMLLLAADTPPCRHAATDMMLYAAYY